METTYPVRCFSEDENGHMVIGTKGEGIKIIDIKEGQVLQSITTADGLLSNSIYAITKNRNGDLFIGGDGDGLNILNSKSNTLYSLHIPTGYPSFRSVYSILFNEDESKVWVGTVNLGFIEIELEKRESSIPPERLNPIQ